MWRDDRGRRVGVAAFKQSGVARGQQSSAVDGAPMATT